MLFPFYRWTIRGLDKLNRLSKKGHSQYPAESGRGTSGDIQMVGGVDPGKTLLKATPICLFRSIATPTPIGAVPMCMHSSSPGASGQKPMSVRPFHSPWNWLVWKQKQKPNHVPFPSFFFPAGAALLSLGGRYSCVARSVSPLIDVRTAGLRKLGSWSSPLSDSAPSLSFIPSS